jgi:hypothetical protein
MGKYRTNTGRHRDEIMSSNSVRSCQLELYCATDEQYSEKRNTMLRWKVMDQLFYAMLMCGLCLVLPVLQVRAQTLPAHTMNSLSSINSMDNHDLSEHHPWWVNLGAGPALIGTNVSMNAGMVYSYQFDQSIISARILGSTNDNPTVQEIDRSRTLYKMADYGILYGPLWRTPYGYLSVGAGVGLVRAAYETPAGISSSSSISLPMEAQWFWRFTSHLGICVYTYATLNSEKPLYGILIGAQLGVW